jgi:hypothetical protein
MLRKLLPVFLILALAATACGFSIDLPSTTPGATVTDPISVAQPADMTTSTHLVLSFGAGELTLTPGADGLVSGTATYNVADFKPEISNLDHTVSIIQGNYTLNKFPNFGDFINKWDLQLGTAPMDLDITAGAYQATMELGNLSLTNLTVKDGASDVNLAFSTPNRTEMNLLQYETGASQVTLEGLGNANFSMLKFTGGAGNYALDFSGNLQRSASVSINSGLGNLTLTIPEGLQVQLTINSSLANVTIGSQWEHSGNTYTQTGTGPLLTIVADIGAANLVVTH